MAIIKQDYIGIGPRLPLAYDKVNGPYGLIVDPTEEIKQNFRNLMLTNPGERIMNSDFGVGLSRFLFENFTTEVQEDISERVYTQTERYLPSVTVNFVKSVFDEGKNQLYVRIEYFIPVLGINDLIDLKIENTSVSL
jgi:phage baseplate assembly protein W